MSKFLSKYHWYAKQGMQSYINQGLANVAINITDLN